MELDLPDLYKKEEKYLNLRHEEEAICWLWAYPTLLNWKTEIQWLYTPVVGNKRWPGDLWGIDKDGDLLIIECKQMKRNDDPFIDFVQYHSDNREELSSRHWVEKFEKHYTAELKYDHVLDTRVKLKTDGIVPRSNKRTWLRTWKNVAERIDNFIRSSAYKDRVNSFLNVREETGNRKPFYIGLLVQNKEQQQPLSDKAIDSRDQLIQKVGLNNVLAYSIYGVRAQSDKVGIYCSRIIHRSL